MPNQRYDRGAKFEREVVEMFRGMGCTASRTGGSHGLYDVIAVKPHKETIFYTQCKTSGALSIADWNELVVHAFAYGGVAVLAQKENGHVKLEWLTGRTKPREIDKPRVTIDLLQQNCWSHVGLVGSRKARMLEVYPPCPSTTVG